MSTLIIRRAKRLPVLLALALMAGIIITVYWHLGPGAAQAQSDPPDAPTGLEVTSFSHSSVSLSWDDPSDTSITGYQILRRDIVNQPAGTFTTVNDDTGSQTTSYTDSTVAQGTRYAYRIRARNANGLSPRSGYVNVTTSTDHRSGDTRLSRLSVGGMVIPGFTPARRQYQFSVMHSTSQVTIAATPRHHAASVEYSNTDAGTDSGHQVDLSAGRNTITITVTAENGATAEYTLSINKAVETLYGWKVIDDFNWLAAAGNTNLGGVWTDGTTMWVSDLTDDKIYAYWLTGMARDRSKEINSLKTAGNHAPRGLWSNGETMWVSDEDDGKIYAYTLSSGARDASKEFDNLRADGNHHPRGIWSNGDTMWILDGTSRKLYAYRMSDRSRDPSKDIDTLVAAGNRAPAGMWSNGYTMWVADDHEDKLYAYRMSDGAHDSGKDFDTLTGAGNDFIEGITSYGATMWVTDRRDEKLYSYNAPVSTRVGRLTVDGRTPPGFGYGPDGDLETWEYGVSSSTTQVTVKAKQGDNNATFSYDGTDVDSNTEGHQVNISPGANAFSVTVTVPRPTTSKTYTLNINRGVTTDYGWKATDDFDTLRLAGNGDPDGIWSNGTTTWVAGRTDKKLYAYNVSDMTRDPDNDFDTLDEADNDDPRGIWSNGTVMWVADHVDKKLYAYNMSDKARNSDLDFTSLDVAGNDNPVGIWSNGTTMWVVDDEDDKLYAYSVSGRTRDSGKDFDTLGGANNNGPVGIWSDGTTMWVSDSDDKNVRAYSVSDKTRDRDEDFGTLDAAGNDDPRGVWSRGNTLWVADGADGKLYSYNHGT